MLTKLQCRMFKEAVIVLGDGEPDSLGARRFWIHHPIYVRHGKPIACFRASVAPFATISVRTLLPTAPVL